MKMSPQGIMSSEKASNSPGLCPVEGQKPSLGIQTGSWNEPSSLSLGVTKTSPPYPMLVNQPASNPSSYILPKDSQVRLWSDRLLEQSRPKDSQGRLWSDRLLEQSQPKDSQGQLWSDRLLEQSRPKDSQGRLWSNRLLEQSRPLSAR